MWWKLHRAGLSCRVVTPTFAADKDNLSGYKRPYPHKLFLNRRNPSLRIAEWARVSCIVDNALETVMEWYDRWEHELQIHRVYLQLHLLGDGSIVLAQRGTGRGGKWRRWLSGIRVLMLVGIRTYGGWGVCYHTNILWISSLIKSFPSLKKIRIIVVSLACWDTYDCTLLSSIKHLSSLYFLYAPYEHPSNTFCSKKV